VGLNLDETARAPRANVIDPTDPAGFNNSTSVTVFDSLGTARTLSIFFAKAPDPAVNTWNLAVSVDGTQTGNVTLSSANLQFTRTGALDLTASTQPIIATIDLTGVATELGFTNGATTPMTIALDFTNATQFGTPFGVNALTQDGFASGRLTGVEIDKSGVAFAQYTNGQSKAVAQVALANFRNPAGLQPLGEGTWIETFASGQPLTGQPGTGTFGQIRSGAVEGSNVELTEQLVNMIQAQRNFQANAQVISTHDQLTQTIINLR
jgi:flagellar hook protein FlgE